MNKLTPLAKAIGDALLKHHEECCSSIDAPPEKVTEQAIEDSTIPYLVLLSKAQVADFLNPMSVGKYLDELASWSKHGFHPINALAVNGETGVPGAGFDDAEGCANWPEQVRECIAYKKYPPTMAAGH